MKKAYVKPVMESEEFVANEYVAACWTLTCITVGHECAGKTKIVKAEKLDDIVDDYIDLGANWKSYVGAIGESGNIYHIVTAGNETNAS